MKKSYWTLLVLIAFVLSSCGSDDNETPRLSYEEQLAIDIEIIDNYLSKNSITAETDISGLRYVIVEEGTGANPTLNNKVVVSYEGSLLSDGKVFDGNLEDPDGLNFPLNRLIVGWQIGLPKIKAGGSIILYIPSGLGYGPTGSGSIPPNANLIFTVDLLDVQ